MKKLLLALLMFSGLYCKSQVTPVYLDASASKDSDGVISHFKWTQVGTTPSVCVFANDTLAKTTVVPSGGKQWSVGTYTFQIAVTDNQGSTSTAQVHVTCSATQPIVGAGADQTIQLPANSVQLHATGSVTLGIVKSWAWTQVSGPNTATFNRKDTSLVTISGLVSGVYNFQIALTDNYGQIATDQVSVIVKAANIPPKANAGSDQTIYLPNVNVTIGGIDTPSDVAIRWTRKSGYFSVISSYTNAFTKVTFFYPGTYVFTKTVTDKNGNRASDDVSIIVKR